MGRAFLKMRLAFAAGLLAVSAAYLAPVQKVSAQTANAPMIEVRASAIPSPTPNPEDFRPKLNHIMPEVAGTQITVTKKATVIKLDQQPPIQNSNEQELFTKAPGLLVTEQQNPGQFNFSYRGLGNPQESEYVTVLQDGLPLMSDWIGFPTLYYHPLPQSVSEVQIIRGGSSLLYGPEPAPAVNFVSKHPAPGSPWNTYLEGIGGGDGYYSGYGAVQEASGPIEMRIDGAYQHSDGQRDNGEYRLWQANGYLGYRPDDKQLLALDVHASRFSGGDPGRLTFQQFLDDQNFSPTPYNHNWVDRYTVALRYELEFGDGWLMQAKAWYTHQDIDSRTAGNLSPAGLPPATTTLGYEEFNNGGADLRFRKKWGEDTMFRGSALTFGAVVYHGDAPFQRFTSTDLFATRGETTDVIPLDQSRNSDYQAFFVEDLLRIGKFHIVPSFRLDHESVEVNSTHAPFVGMGPPQSRDFDDVVPLWGIGLGNDFGHNNETYFSASSGWRPTRYFDIAGTSRTVRPDEAPDPFTSLDFELGVHGTPIKGLWYDVGFFWMEFDNRTETQNISNTEFVIINSGSTRHRGFEGELSYDFLAPFQHDPNYQIDPKSSGKEVAVPVVWHPLQLIVFNNIQLLDAEFTDSTQIVPGTGRSFVGNEPAFAPSVLWKGGITFRKEKCFNVTFSGVYASDQFWADSNLGNAGIPAQIPSYKVFNLSGEFYVTKNVRVIAGISNLFDEKYYSRVFFNGTLEPAAQRTGYAGLSVEF
jgi:Fe(3+) dicitrate transport protein